MHRLDQAGVYMVTAGTYLKEHYFSGADRLDALQGGLLKYAAKHAWRLEAWAVFPNHYHFVARSPEDAPDGAESLRLFLANFHQHSASWVNGLDGATGRKVWHNYRDTRLSYEKSYFARLNYVHQNAVKHGVVRVASQYSWCSAAWFERVVPSALVKTIYGFKTDRVQIPDEY